MLFWEGDMFVMLFMCECFMVYEDKISVDLYVFRILWWGNDLI